MKKKTLLSSILTIALCFSLIVGSTFALFTSTKTTNVAVTAGTVRCSATIDEFTLYSPRSISASGNILDDANDATETNFKNGGTATLTENKLTLSNIVPGDKVMFNVTITNNSTVTVQYRSIVQKISDNGLFEGLKVTIGDEESSYTGATVKSAWSVMNVGSEAITIPVVIELPTTAGNTYQGKSCELAFTVEAVQGGVAMPDEVYDGSSVEEPEQDEDGVYHITNAAQFVQYIDSFSGLGGPSYRGQYHEAKVVLDCNIDLGGVTFERTSASYFYGQFDGQEHVVSNFVIRGTEDTGFTSLFAAFDSSDAFVMNLTVENATIVATQGQAAVIANAVYSGTVENCHTVNCTVVGEKKVAAVASYTQENGTIKDCSATGCYVYASAAHEEQVTLFGFYNGGTYENNTDGGNNVVEAGRSIDYVLTNANEFKAYVTGLANQPQLESHRYDGATAILTNDVDLGGAVITASGEGYAFSGNFDGLGHTVSNYVVKRTDGEYYTGLFSGYLVEGGEIKNLTVKNGTVISNGNQVGAIVPSVYANGTVDNCHAIDCTVTGVKKVGAVAGYLESNEHGVATVKNCSASGNTIIASNNAVIDASIFGYDNGGTFTNNVDNGGNTLRTGVSDSFAADVAGITSALTSANNASGSSNEVNISLLADIAIPDGFTPIDIGFYGDYRNVTSLTIDCNGHTISGLTTALVEKVSGNCTVTIKNLTVKDAHLNNNAYTNGMGNGIIIGYVENGSVTLENCTVVDSSVTESSVAAAALIGYVASSSLPSATINLENCTVKNTEINGDSAAGFIGYVQQETVTVTNCKVEESSFTGERAEKQGEYFGTVNSGATVNIDSDTTTDNTDPNARVGRILNGGAVNYN